MTKPVLDAFFFQRHVIRRDFHGIIGAENLNEPAVPGGGRVGRNNAVKGAMG